MGAAWPPLADLSVLYHLIGTYSPSLGQHTQGGVSVTRPTLAGVIELVTLKVCELDLDAGTVPVPELEGAEDSPDAVPRLGGWHGLRSFVASNVLQPCAPQKYAEVAAVLDRVFRAINVEHSQRLMGWASGGKDWKDILRLLGTIRLGRDSEKSGLNAGPPPASTTK